MVALAPRSTWIHCGSLNALDQRVPALPSTAADAGKAAVLSEDEAVAAGERLGWDVVLKATAERLRQRPDQAHVWRNIDTEEEMRDAWESLMGIISDPADAEFVVQRTAAPGVPVAVGVLEDGCAAATPEFHRAAIEGLRPVCPIVTIADAMAELDA